VAWPIYSERLLSTPGHVGWVLLDVPSGRRAVVKQIAVVNYGGEPVYVQVAVRAEAIWGRSVPGPLNSLQDSGMWVAYGGEQLGIYCAAAGVGVSLHGFLFASAGDEAIAARAGGHHELDENDGPIGVA
jgi:hypothetical protein